MSEASKLAWSGLSAARKRLAELAANLRSAASGSVTAAAAEKVADLVRKVATAKLSAHEESGAAAGLTVVDVSGGLVELHGMPGCNGKKWAGKSYVSTFGWWPFRRGMPPFILKQAGVIYARELLAAIGGRGHAAGALAEATVDEADASAAKSAAKSVARKQASAQRREDRRIKARESREDRHRS